MRGLIRGIYVLMVAARFHLPLPYVKWLLPLFPSYWGFGAWRDRRLSSAERLCLAFERLGPVWIKLGQLLSTRFEDLPERWILALIKLQDNVASPLSGEKAEAHIRAALGDLWQQALVDFTTEPLASASIAQVHRATLSLQGQEHQVVVKLLKPGVEKSIARDVQLLRFIGRLLSLVLQDAKRLRLALVVDEVEDTLSYELDLLREASCASVLKRHFEHKEDALYVPKVYWDFCRKDVMVSEYIEGIRIDDVEALDRSDIDRCALAKLGLNLFFTQVFEHRFFHADMHPGNVWVQKNGDGARYAVMDFGIMGTLDDRDQRYIAENLLAFFKRDYRRVAQLHLESGWVPSDVRLDAFEAAIRAVCEPIFAKPLGEISFGALLLGLFQTARSFQVEVQPQLILLQKTLVQVEALGRRLDPQLNLWQTAQPFLENWMASQLGLKGFAKKVMDRWPLWLERMPDLPDRIYALLEQKPISSPPPPPSMSKPLVMGWILGVISAALLLWRGWG